MPAFRSHTTGTTDVNWDGPAQKTKVRSGENRTYYGKIFAWYDPEADEGNKSDYRFIHHMVAENGDPGDANTFGCSQGIGVLNGGRGGTTIPDADRQGVYDHLAKHIKDAGKEPPELASVELPHRHGGTENFEYAEILKRATMEAWAILPTALSALLAMPRSPSPQPSPSQGEGVEALTRPGPKSGRVAMVPIMGPISRRDSLWSGLFGGTSVEGLIKTLREVGADTSIGTVLLNVDSPGGTVSGIPELAAEVRRLREGKQVIAMANSLMASAAYWIAAQADEIIAAPEALVGSVGVFAVHEDWSKFYENAGVRISYISAGRYKIEGNFEEPLTEEARSHMQAIVDDAYALFVADVARGRSTSPAAVKAGYGEGRVLTAKDAKAAGLVDRVAGFGETVQRLMGVRPAAHLAAGEDMGKAEMNPHPDPLPIRERGNDGGNSQAHLNALKRRRLDLLKKTYVEVER